jgi:hypothetical protein
MKTPKDIIVYFMEKVGILSLYSLAKTGPLKEDGWLRSFQEKSSVDADGNPIPWFTYPATEFLKRRIHPDMSLFEYGCGFSTLWWSKRVNEIISVEHVEDWYNNIVTLVPENVELHHIMLEYNGAYSKKIKEYRNRFDIVVLDGRDRINCAKNSLPALKESGILIWDNSDRKEYESGYNFLYKNGFRKIEFVGLVPIINFKSETGIFYRPNNCLGI